MAQCSFALEDELRSQGALLVAGIDEAGRGCLAGPVFAAAVIFPQGVEAPRGLNDSKQLSAAKREKLYEALMADSRVIKASAQASVAEIDKINILKASHLAMQRAVEKLSHHPDGILIDGLPVKGFPWLHRGVVGGDGLSLSIAAASIIAKVERDNFMLQAAEDYPGYAFEKHKGYGTAAHLEALRSLGPCPLHRMTFGPVAQLELAL